VIAESIHGIIRQLFIAPVIGKMPARQVVVLIGSAIIFAIALGVYSLDQYQIVCGADQGWVALGGADSHL